MIINQIKMVVLLIGILLLYGCCGKDKPNNPNISKAHEPMKKYTVVVWLNWGHQDYQMDNPRVDNNRCVYDGDTLYYCPAFDQKVEINKNPEGLHKYDY